MDLQVTALPRPKARLFLADAAAIKVSLLALGWNICLQPGFVGSHNLSCQISQACGYIHRVAYFWDKHRCFRRRRVEEVPKNRRASILGGQS